MCELRADFIQPALRTKPWTGLYVMLLTIMQDNILHIL